MLNMKAVSKFLAEQKDNVKASKDNKDNKDSKANEGGVSKESSEDEVEDENIDWD